jgi:dynein heavy chain, axonemal
MQEVKVVSQHCNLIQALGNRSMQQRHWAKIFALLESGAPPANTKQFSLQQLLSEGIDQHYEKIEEISSMASGEATIEQTLREIIAVWKQANFTVLNYRDTKDRFIIGEIEDTITQLEDH